jgi:branched-chain amino acid transport system ATP-binding protein
MDDIPALAVDALSVSYGSVRAVRGLDLRVRRNELVALLGANGAGKSSTLKAIMGLAPVSHGGVFFEGRPIRGLATEEIVRRGLTLVPEGRRVFPRLSVEQNLLLGGSGLGARKHDGSVQSRIDNLYSLFPILGERRQQAAGTLSGGEQQQLAIARALMSDPHVLLLDEPSLGLAPQAVEMIFGLIDELHHRGVTMLLVEQNVHVALEVASRAYVLASGALQLAGDADELLNSTGIDRAYLGIGAA